MKIKLLMCATITAAVLYSSAAFAQDDPFDGGFPIYYKAEVFTMGAQNDSLHSWAFGWDEDNLVPIGDGSFPESYQCGKMRDIARGDFDGDYLDEVVVVWDRADSGVFVGIPTIDPATLAPDPGGWNLPDVPIASGVLYATDTLTEILGEIRVVAGNFYDDPAMEFVLAYLAADSTVSITVFDVDTSSLTPEAGGFISDQAVNTDLPEFQRFGAVSRFDIATGDFDGDGLDEVALVVNDPAESPETDLVLIIYDYDPSSHTLNPQEPISYTANSEVNHTCLRSVLMETGNFEADSLDEIAIVDSWSRGDIDSSRVGGLHAIKLTTAMTSIDASQMQSLPSCSWHNDVGLNGSVHIMTTYKGELIIGGSFTAAGGFSANNIVSWDGTRWKPLGAGVNSGVEALEVYEGDLIVGGYFTEAGGGPANHLARWDGSSWEEFGGGANNNVFDLLATNSVSAGSLFACGDFTQVGGDTTANRIARWDGSVWQKVGGSSGLNARALEMMEHGDRIVVTGHINWPTIDKHYIASWLPSNPDTLGYYGKGFYDYGHALANVRGSLTGGGNFTKVSGKNWLGTEVWVSANRIAWWSGDRWNAIDNGLDSMVFDLLFNPGDSNLYIGGRFETANGLHANRIARWHWAIGGGTWHTLGDGVAAATGIAEVVDMCFYNGDLIAGGKFDHAGGIEAGNIARWDGAAWHSFESPRYMSIGLAVGKIRTEGELDDIFIAAFRDNSGVNIAVYGADTSAASLKLCEEWNMIIASNAVVSDGLARSRRTVAVDDVDENGRPDLAVILLDSADCRIAVYEPILDTENLCAFNDMPLIGSSEPITDDLTELVLADLDSATVELGPPTYYVLDSIIQPLVILNVPPVHYDILNGTDTANINDRCPWPPVEPYETYCAYGMFTDSSTSITSVIRKDWGISAGLEGHISAAGAKIKSHLSTEYGEGFTATEDSGVIIHTESVMENHAEDLILAAKISYDVWEYPVYWGGERIEGGDVVVINPRTVQKTWMQGRDVRQWIPDHEVDNILSYQSYGDPANNPMVSTEDVLTGISHLMAVGTNGHWVLTKQVMTTNGYEESSDFGVEVGASIGYEGGMKFFGVGFKYGLEVSVEGTYDKSELNTYSTTVANKDSIHVEYGSIVSTSPLNTATYNITPYAYWSKNGALVLDYFAEPAGSWWIDHYTGVDPAFILPWRFDPEKYRVDDNEQRYQTKEIVFIPNTPSPGDTVLIIARVHNFGLNPISDTVKVSFYFGDPYTGGHLLYDKDGDSVFYARDIDGFVSGIESRGAAAAQMVWSVPADESIAKCQLIYALIDPFDEISPEIHDNDDAFSNNKGWKLLRVNTTTECYDPDEDGLSASAYECCVTKGDNCPSVFNDDQTDSDGDGIGDACEDAVCGDANSDLSLNVGDAVYLINYVFKSGPAPDPLCGGDANDDDGVNVGDAVYMINYVFKSGPPPPETCCQ